MSGRRLRKLLFFAAVAGLAYWIYRDRPSISGIVDSLTSPLLGSRAAVNSSERNRVNDDATTVIADQSAATVATLKERMTKREVRELLGDPQKIENEDSLDAAKPERWTYTRIRRVLTFQDGRVSSIAIQ